MTASQKCRDGEPQDPPKATAAEKTKRCSRKKLTTQTTGIAVILWIFQYHRGVPSDFRAALLKKAFSFAAFAR